MAGFKIVITDVDGLGDKLATLANFGKVADRLVKRQATEMYNRGKSDGGTPVDTGELMGSLTQSGGDEVGYSKEYAPHVEFGHRTVGGGYVEGQHYLEANVKAQEPIYKRQLLKLLEDK